MTPIEAALALVSAANGEANRIAAIASEEPDALQAGALRMKARLWGSLAREAERMIGRIQVMT